RLGNGVEDRYAFDILATLARRHATDDLRAVGLVAQTVVLALPAGEALDNDLGVLIDEDRHGSVPVSVSTRDRHRCPRGLQHRRLALQHALRNSCALEDLAALFGVGAVESDHDRRAQLHAVERFDDALGHFLAASDAAEDVDEDALHVLV